MNGKCPASFRDCEAPAYCQFTDATLPTPHRSLERVCASRALAEYFARKLNREQDDADLRFVVWPVAPLAPVAFNDDEIPF